MTRQCRRLQAHPSPQGVCLVPRVPFQAAISYEYITLAPPELVRYVWQIGHLSSCLPAARTRAWMASGRWEACWTCERCGMHSHICRPGRRPKRPPRRGQASRRWRRRCLADRLTRRCRCRQLTVFWVVSESHSSNHTAYRPMLKPSPTMISPPHQLSTCILPSAPSPLRDDQHANCGQSCRNRQSVKRRQRHSMTATGAVRAGIGLEPPTVKHTAADVCSSGRAVRRAGGQLLRPLTPAASLQESVCRAVLVCDGIHSHAFYLNHKSDHVQCQACDGEAYAQSQRHARQISRCWWACRYTQP